jgi:carbamoyltransferase
MEHASWGQEYGRPEIAAALEAAGAAYTPFDDEDRLLDHVVDRLERGRVVGWSQGRFEWGPRALGHRSILADPRRPEMRIS